MKNQGKIPNIMITDLIGALSGSEIDVDVLKNLKIELSNWLITQKTQEIYPQSHISLVAGKIEGGIDVKIAMIDHGAPEDEIQVHIDSVKMRIQTIILS